MGLRIYRDLEELLIEGVPHERLRARGAPHRDASPSPGRRRPSVPLVLLRQVLPGRRGSRLLFKVRSGTSGQLPGSGREMLPYRQIVFAGFYALTECERRLFKELLSWENVCFLFHEGPGLTARLASLGIAYCPRPSDERRGGRGRTASTFTKAPMPTARSLP